MQKIVPFLWFDHQAEEAADFYSSIFDSSKILEISRYGKAGPGPAGTAMVVSFQLAEQEFNALNGGPQFKFTEAISLVVNCEDQAEVDHFWEKLSADGGEESMCGWLTDKYGLSWQIVSTALSSFIAGPDPAGAQRAVQPCYKCANWTLQNCRKPTRENERQSHFHEYHLGRNPLRGNRRQA